MKISDFLQAKIIVGVIVHKIPIKNDNILNQP